MKTYTIKKGKQFGFYIEQGKKKLYLPFLRKYLCYQNVINIKKGKLKAKRISQKEMLKLKPKTHKGTTWFTIRLAVATGWWIYQSD